MAGWAALTALLAVGVLISIADLAKVSVMETQRANAQGQRVIIDPVTGAVAGGSASPTETLFDVASETDEKTLPGDAEAPAEPTADGAADNAAATATDTESPDEATAPSEPSEAIAIEDRSFLPLDEAAAAGSVPTVERSAASLVMAPAPEITETVKGKKLPKIGEKDARASRLYARPAPTVGDEKKTVAIVVTQAGFSTALLKTLIALPPEIGIALSPYAPKRDAQMQALRNSGHELWAMLPVLQTRYPQSDPGPLGLVPGITAAEVTNRLRAVLSDMVGAVGFLLPADEAITKQPALWAPVRDEILQRGLVLLTTRADRSAEQLASDAEMQAQIRRADIDATRMSEAMLRSKLAGLGTLMEQQPSVVITVPAQPRTIALLQAWLAEKPFGEQAVLVPASALYRPAETEAEAPVDGHGSGEEEAESSGHGGH